MKRDYLFIAEVKTKSPFGFKSKRSWDELFKIANQHGDMIAVHTDPRWGGSLDLIRKARALTQKEILAKGIHAGEMDVYDAFLARADYALAVGCHPRGWYEYSFRLFFEPESFDEIRRLPRLRTVQLVWNSRDLKTGGLKKETIEDVRKIWPKPLWLCQASNIRTPADIYPGVDAILVGTHLEEFVGHIA